ncbi:DUF3134 family protein [Okeania sp. KiyG1]
MLSIPRYELTDVIPSQRDSFIVDWLETSGKMLPCAKNRSFKNK